MGITFYVQDPLFTSKIPEIALKLTFMSNCHLLNKTVVAITSLSLIFLTNNGCSKSGLRPDNSLTGNSVDQYTASAPSLRTIPLLEFIIDQSDTVLKNINSRNTLYASPFGQEFTPKFQALDAVELKFDDASCSLAGSNGGTMKVQIRKGTIDGAIIGTSVELHFVNCFFGKMRFDFPQFIKVSPGEIYVIEPLYVSGNTSTVFIDEGPGSLYPGGQLILNGLLDSGKDMYFKEGLYNFVARTKEQVKEVGWENLVRADGSIFRIHGECMKYIEGN